MDRVEPGSMLLTHGSIIVAYGVDVRERRDVVGPVAVMQSPRDAASLLKLGPCVRFGHVTSSIVRDSTVRELWSCQ